MASSSSSSYDVFINFRGPDTREKFVRPLYDALEGSNISTYIDSEELWKGEKIEPTLVRAIQNSKISLPVFSNNYAHSKFCLLELAQIWKCQLLDSQIVIPIFIGVEPMDIKYQIGSFQEPFEKYQRNREPAINGWRNALTEVGNLSGWTLKGDADPKEQLDTINSVVNRVLGELYRTPLAERRHIIGVDFDVAEVIRLLDIDSNNVQFVGICGMGGLGKTTIAKVVLDRIGGRFNRCCFLRDVNQKASKGDDTGLVFLQEKLLQYILKRKYDISDVSEGESLISQNLYKKKILVILDGVEEEEQLVSLAGGLNWFGPGSKVIITTRDKHILKVHEKKIGRDIQIHMPTGLNTKNSLHLFSLHVFSEREPPAKYRQLSCEVVEYAGGLPLTLEVLGSFLVDKNKEQWEDTLERLKDTKSIQDNDGKVFASLMISYNKLGDHEKTIFLDVACNLIDMDGSMQISIWEACKLQPKLAIEELKQKHLVEVIDEEDEWWSLWMHDQLRYMGRRIVSQNTSEDPTKQSRLWRHDDLLNVLKRNMENQKMVEGVLIDRHFKFEGDDVLRYEDFEKMPNLRFLQVQENNLNGDFLRLPSSLKWFYWAETHLERTLPANFHHKELLHLMLYNRSLELAWNDAPQNTKKFQKLEVLSLTSCRELSVSRNFLSWFPCLKSLEIARCSSFFELPDCISQMWPSLNTLIVSSCSSFNKLPTTIGDLKHLVKLWVEDAEIEEIPDGVGQLEKLEELTVLHCPTSRKLVNLPTSMSRMRSLRHINLEGTMIAKLPDDFSKLSSLEVFRMPSSLSKVDQSTCYVGLQPIPINLSVFSQLQELCLSDDPTSLESFPELPLILTTLRVKRCHSLKMTPDLSHLERLKELSIILCSSLEHLERLPSNLICLNCRDCKSLVRLPNLSNLKSLKNLGISHCNNLEGIDGLEGTKSLEDFNVTCCYKLTEPTRKILGKGLLKPNFCEAHGSKSIADDEVRNGSPILCVVFNLKDLYKEEDCRVEIEARIRRGEKYTNFWILITIGHIRDSNHANIIYIHHFKGFDWFGFPLESNDVIEDLTATTSRLDKGRHCEIEAEYVKVLFENKESNHQMPDQQSSAMLVADFFIWDEDDDDHNSSEEDDDQDDDDEDNSSSEEADAQDDYEEDQDDYEFGEDDQQTLDQPSHAQEKEKTSLEEEEKTRPSKRACLHHNDEEASSGPLFVTLTPYDVEEYWKTFPYPLGQEPNIGDDVQGFPSSITPISLSPVVLFLLLLVFILHIWMC